MNSDAISIDPSAYRPCCPRCGAPLRRAKPKRCWLCESKISPHDLTPEVQALASMRPTDAGSVELLQRIRRRETSSEPRVGFIILMVLLGLLAAGLLAAAPGLLIVFAILGTPVDPRSLESIVVLEVADRLKLRRSCLPLRSIKFKFTSVIFDEATAYHLDSVPPMRHGNTKTTNVVRSVGLREVDRAEVVAKAIPVRLDAQQRRWPLGWHRRLKILN